MNLISKQTTRQVNGFTLVEIMIVVVIIGFLASMAYPAFKKARVNSMASRIANDYRSFSGAFEIAAMEEGTWPEDTDGNDLPLSAKEYINADAWSQGVVKGSYWDWEGFGRHGVSASINFVDNEQNLDSGVMERVDEILDDGNLSSGLVRSVTANEYIYIIEK